MNEPRPVISRDVLDLAREAGDGALPPGASRRARDRFEEALAGPEARSGRVAVRPFPRGWAPLFAVAALALVIVASAASMRLRFAVSGATIAEGNFVRTAEAAPATIAFSDGTRVELEARGAVRVADAGLRGADLVQERGRATYAVVHRPVAAWSVEAGPYRVRVTGTRFSVAWSPESGSFVAELYEGSVTIDGPSTGSGVELRAGQRLRAATPGAIVVEEMSGDPGAGASPAPLGSGATPADAPAKGIATAEPAASVPAASDAAPPATASAEAAPSAKEAAPRSLAERLAQGESAAIADELEREGVASFAGRASAGDLAIAADAARYAGKSALANATLNALRARHPGSREAALAAFHLGRAAEGASPSAAVTWYDTYLNETGGGGALAVEARGRKMAVVARTAGNAAARPLAEAYLAQSPKGPHAALARSILAAP